MGGKKTIRFPEEPAIPAAQRYWTLCLRLPVYRKRFRCAIEVFDKAEEGFAKDFPAIPPDKMPMYHEWMLMAGRDGAMSLYHFWAAMSHAMAWASKNPAVIDCLDRDAIRAARRQFDERFPKIKEIRDSVAHTSDFLKEGELQSHYRAATFRRADNPEEVQAIDIILLDTFNGKRFVTYKAREELGYDRSIHSFDILTEIERSFIHAARALPRLGPGSLVRRFT
jgi:hypothetical protein